MTLGIVGARYHSGPTSAGSYPAIFYLGGGFVKELSVFVDESGDFGPYEYHTPFYIVTLVFHDQSASIDKSINHMNVQLRQAGFSEHTIHTGPLIRREHEYKHLSLFERKRIFNILYNFTRVANITYKNITVEKRQLSEKTNLHMQLTKRISAFLKENMDKFIQFDRIIVYYDYGQHELTHIIVTMFSTIFSNVQFKKATPERYKLFQAADMLCTLELLSMKSEQKLLSKSEYAFFVSSKNLHKSYLRAIQGKQFS